MYKTTVKTFCDNILCFLLALNLTKKLANQKKQQCFCQIYINNIISAISLLDLISDSMLKF